MAEAFDRCRFWPNCEIHKHLITPRYFSRRNIAEMFRMWLDGAGMEEIAREFQTTRSTVSRACRYEARRLRAAYAANELEEASTG